MVDPRSSRQERVRTNVIAVVQLPHAPGLAVDENQQETTSYTPQYRQAITSAERLGNFVYARSEVQGSESAAQLEM